MSYWILIPILFLVAVFQTTLLPLVPIFGFTIDFALVLVIGWGLLGPAWEAAQWGFIVGIFLDVASGLPFGAHALALTLIGLAMSAAQLVFFRGNLATPPFAGMLGTLAYNLILLGVLSLAGRTIEWNEYVFRITLPTALLNTLVLTLLYFPLQWIARHVNPQLEFR
jgi:rod shape-determining protein MreD